MCSPRRLKFFQDWIDYGAPHVFWLSGFYFTQSYLTGVLQNFARREHLPIDWIHFEFFVTKYEQDVSDEPETGVYCKVSYSSAFFVQNRRKKERKEINLFLHIRSTLKKMMILRIL